MKEEGALMHAPPRGGEAEAASWSGLGKMNEKKKTKEGREGKRGLEGAYLDEEITELILCGYLLLP